MRKFPATLFTAGALWLCLSAPLSAAESPRVVTTIKPLHSLVAMILDGIAEPYLIVKGAGSPHGHAMRPSDARALADADVVFWIGPDLETFMTKPLASLASKARVVALLDSDKEEHHDKDHAHEKDHADGRGHGHDNKDHAHEKDHADGHRHGHGGADPHIWLSPEHAVEMLETIARVMTDAAPAHAASISKNREHAIDQLIEIDAEVRRLVYPMQDDYLMVLHEAYGHFTEHFGLRDFIALSVTPEHKPTPGRISDLRKQVVELGVRCIFAEPQFPDSFVTLLSEGTKARPGVIDPLGAQLMPGPDLYPQLLRLMGFAIRGCYEETS